MEVETTLLPPCLHSQCMNLRPREVSQRKDTATAGTGEPPPCCKVRMRCTSECSKTVLQGSTQKQHHGWLFPWVEMQCSESSFLGVSPVPCPNRRFFAQHGAVAYYWLLVLPEHLATHKWLCRRKVTLKEIRANHLNWTPYDGIPGGAGIPPQKRTAVGTG